MKNSIVVISYTLFGAVACVMAGMRLVRSQDFEFTINLCVAAFFLGQVAAWAKNGRKD